MDRFIDGIELTAAVFIGIVALDVFLTVMLRYAGVSIPDSYDLGQLLLGILIFSGSLYSLALGAPRIVGAITPVGGLLLIAGWLFFAWEARRRET